MVIECYVYNQFVFIGQHRKRIVKPLIQNIIYYGLSGDFLKIFAHPPMTVISGFNYIGNALVCKLRIAKII